MLRRIEENGETGTKFSAESQYAGPAIAYLSDEYAALSTVGPIFVYGGPSPKCTRHRADN